MFSKYNKRITRKMNIRNSTIIFLFFLKNRVYIFVLRKDKIQMKSTIYFIKNLLKMLCNDKFHYIFIMCVANYNYTYLLLWN